MFVLGNLCQAVAFILNKLLWLYSLVVLISVLLSWVSADPFNPIVQVLRSMTVPVFTWVRKRVPFAVVGMMDLSPILVLVAIQFLQMVVVQSLYQLSYQLR
jgi:YggT family protein